MAYNTSPLDTSPTSTQIIKVGGDAINENFTQLPGMISTAVSDHNSDTGSHGMTVLGRNILQAIDTTTARTLLELGDSSTLNVGITAGTVASGETANKDIVNDSVVGVGLYAGGQRLEWTKAFAATTGALVFEITGVYAVTTMVGKMTITVAEASKPDRVFLVEGRWNGGLSDWDEARCIELTEGSTELLPIRFSVDAVNQKTFIIIGNVGSTWNNLRIKIDDVLTNWNDTLNLGFVITETIDFTGLTHTFEFNPTRYEVAVKTTVTTTAPTINDDNTLGYAVWSPWLDTVTGNIYICVNANTGAAVWKPIT